MFYQFDLSYKLKERRKELDRNFIFIEKEQKYCDIAKNRLIYT